MDEDYAATHGDVTPGQYAMVALTDTGSGIDPATLEHVTEAFYRGDAGHPRRGEGAGIGLALAKWIANEHDAHLRIESTPGSGSTFHVDFGDA